jgi:hypothetical protein
MYTLTDIYNRLNTGTTTAKRTGAFTEPSSGPAATGKTLDDVMDLVNSRSPVEKTGQTTSYSATSGEDGDLQKGVTWPSPRFTDNGNGTVSDNLTGLIWLKNANPTTVNSWENALSYCNGLANGTAGLTDGSVAGDWRLPHVKELQSLVDYGRYTPALSNTAGTGQWTEGNPFSDVLSDQYWSSTTGSSGTSSAWCVNMDSGEVRSYTKGNSYFIWPVRGGR